MLERVIWDPACKTEKTGKGEWEGQEKGKRGKKRNILNLDGQECLTVLARSHSQTAVENKTPSNKTPAVSVVKPDYLYFIPHEVS